MLINSVECFPKVNKGTKSKMIFFQNCFWFDQSVYLLHVQLSVLLYFIVPQGSFAVRYLKSLLSMILSSIFEKHGRMEIGL